MQLDATHKAALTGCLVPFWGLECPRRGNLPQGRGVGRTVKLTRCVLSLRPPPTMDPQAAQDAESRRKNLLQAGRAASAGYFFIAAMGVGAGLGYLVDRYLTHSEPMGMLLGFFVGIGAGFRELWLIAKAGPGQPPGSSGVAP